MTQNLSATFKSLLLNRYAHMGLILLMVLGLLALRLADPPLTQELRYMAFDSYNNLHPRERSDMIRILDIDEASLADERLGQWPWPRSLVAQMITNLSEMGAKVIAFDMVFAEQDRTSPHRLRNDLPDGMKELAENELLAETFFVNYDDQMTQAIRRARNVVMGFVWSDNPSTFEGRPFQPRPMRIDDQLRDILKTTAIPMRGAVPNLRDFERRAAGNGNFGVSTEFDGLIRQVPLIFRHLTVDGDVRTLYPSLALETLRVAIHPREIIKIMPTSREETHLLTPPLRLTISNDISIPMDPSGRHYVYYRNMGEEDYISAKDVIFNTINPADVKDKIILVGTSAEGLKDIRSTPLGLFIPGVEVHANIIEQALTDTYLLRPAVLEGAELITLSVGGLLMGSLATFIGGMTLSIIVLVGLLLIPFGSYLAFIQYGLLIDPVFPSLTLGGIYLTALVLAYARTEGARRQVSKAFGMYISPDYMQEISDDPDRLQLGGEIRDLSVMFTDVRQFTSISESLTPNQMIALMNEFLTPMSDIVMEYRGTIDKYIGDAMMAFWNAPLDDSRHAYHACKAALAMLPELEPINARLEAEAKAEGRDQILLKLGIGINTGPCAVGNMGSKQRFAYSALGDAVNLSARLEGQTKLYCAEILIGETTQAQIPELATLELDLIQVKGKKQAVRIFALVGDEKLAEDFMFQTFAKNHDEMLTAYRAQKFDQAIIMAKHCAKHIHQFDLDNLHALRSAAGYYDLMISRCEAYQKTPPPTDWDGVYVAVSK